MKTTLRTDMDPQAEGLDDEIVGMTVDQIETPALLLDLDVFEANCRFISGYLHERGVAWRPHAKGHRSPEIARRQMAFGSIGVTVSKVSEAEAMAQNGIPSVLVTTHQPTLKRWLRLARLQTFGEVIAPVDHPRQIALAREAAALEGAVIPIAVEVDLGMHRSGVPPGERALELGRLVDATPGLRLVGVIGYEGHLLRRWPAEEKDAVIRETVQQLVDTAAQFRAAGLEAGLVSAGGTGSYRITADVPGIGEIQAGGGCFMDLLYAEDCHVTDLGFALTIRTTVASTPDPATVVVDAGWKAMPSEKGNPRPIHPTGLSLRGLSAEHGALTVDEGGPTLEIGDTGRLRAGLPRRDGLPPRVHLRGPGGQGRSQVSGAREGRLQLTPAAAPDRGLVRSRSRRRCRSPWPAAST